MENKRFCKAEEARLHRIINFKLPNSWKKIGWGVLILSIISLIGYRLFDSVGDVIPSILKNAMLLGLLIVVISKEKIEDELVQSLRAKAFSLSFIVAILYVLIQPLINYLVALLIKPEKAIIEDLGDFQILWFLLTVYLVAFWYLKRRR